MKCYEAKKHKFLRNIHGQTVDAMKIKKKDGSMPKLVMSCEKINMIAKAEEIINDFLNGNENAIYVINPDGSTFALEPGCTLLPTERFNTGWGMEV